MGEAQRAHQPKKKELDDALAQLQKDNTTTHPLIVNVSKARKINKVIGFGAITPWQVDELDEDWLSVFEGLYGMEDKKDLLQKSKQNFDHVLARKRAAHPTYRKY